ncbi:glycosyltransferase family 4 protein [Hymenobacter latericus]|nr:glycosyltransferase family 4 protein [Hymenobacter sp. YIM 151858-1]
MYDAPWGGSEVLWSRVAAEALTQGHEVLVCTHAWPNLAAPLQALQRKGAQFYLRPRYNGSVSFRMKSGFRRMLNGGKLDEVRALERFAPDVVLVSQGGWNDLFYHSQVRAWLQQVPYLLICHNYQDPVRLAESQREQFAKMFAEAREVLMISGNQLKTIKRQLAAELANARVVQNPLNLPTVYPIPYPEPSTNGPIAQLAVVASFDVDRKGQDVLLETLSAYQWLQREWHLNLYGQGPDKTYLERLIKYYGLAEKVTLHGHVSDSSHIWTHNHILVLPSRIESGPMVLQEALLCGRAVVAADVGLVRMWLDDGETGIIADASTATSLNTALERAWACRDKWQTMGNLGYKRTNERLETNPSSALLADLIKVVSGPFVEV